MADLISQLQESINQLAEHFCNAVGVLQQSAPAAPLDGYSKFSSDEASKRPDYSELFAKLIAATACDIDHLIDALPDDNVINKDVQLDSIERMDLENQDAGKELEDAVAKGDQMLATLRQSIREIEELEFSLMKQDAPLADSSK